MGGKLILSTEESKDKAIAGTFEPASSASMLDSGNFVLYNNRSDMIWSSFDFPTDTILVGQSLDSGSKLISSVSETNCSTGRFCLNMQVDGNIVLHSANLHESRAAFWASNTSSARDDLTTWKFLNLSPRAVLEAMSSNNTLKFIANCSNSMKNTSETVIYRATLDSDGILRLYSPHFESTGKSNVTIEWSALQNQCEVKGFCGFNSFCSTTNSSTKADCYYFPGCDSSTVTCI